MKGFNFRKGFNVLSEGTTPSDDDTAPVVTAFVIPSTSDSLAIPITTFTATDNVAVTKYKITESATPPLAGALGWTTTAPTTYTFTTDGNKTLYAWAKDAAGNISDSLNDSVVVAVVIPPFPTDIENGGYTSSQIDDWLINHAFTLNTTEKLFVLQGNEIRTSDSDAAYAHLELTNGFYED